MYRYALRQERIVLKYERAAFLIPCQVLRGFDSISLLTFQLISRHSRFGRLPISPDSSILKSNIKTIKGGWWSTWIRPKWELSSRNSGWLLEWRSNSWPNSYILRTRQSHVGKPEFPIVKDTTPNMMNPRLYTTSYNKPQGQQFDDTAVLSFINLQYT